MKLKGSCILAEKDDPATRIEVRVDQDSLDDGSHCRGNQVRNEERLSIEFIQTRI